MNFHDSIVLGAGPAGMQMGYLLETAGRDYLILEGSERVGNFFTKFPRHRRLNSFNKRFNWFSEPDFNLRFDWHSLLTHDFSFPFRGYSKEIFPQADTLAQYLQDFRDHFDIKVQFNTRITYIDRDPETRHLILTTGAGEEYRCRTLLMATGPLKGDTPDIPGIEHASSYEDHNADAEIYENKRVLIIGGGISAFETANHIVGSAAAITVALGPKFMKHAWRTHFAGDLRVHDNTLLDMTALKMMHGIYGLIITRITKQEDGTLRVHYQEEMPHWSKPGVIEGWMPVDHVIRCTGWTFVNPELFAPSIKPQTVCDGQYALLNSTWESTTPDLFFIGTAMAGRNLRSPTTTLHGFRYAIRAVFNFIEQRYENVLTPNRVFPLKTRADLEVLGKEMIRRVSISSGLFQCNSILGDAVVFDKDAGEARVFYEMPIDYFLESPDFAEKTVMYFTLELGFNNFPGQDPNVFVRRNDPSRPGCVGVIHPVARLYENGKFVKGRSTRGSVGSRYDEDYKGFEHEMDDVKPRNIVLNFINEVACVTDETFSENHFFNTEERGGFRELEPGEVLTNPGLPECALVVGGEQVSDFGHFRQVSRRADGTIPPWVHAKLFEISEIH
jgi:thioredoxin reductase